MSRRGREKLSFRNLFFVLTVMRLSTIVAFMPVFSKHAYEDAWLAALVSVLPVIPACYVIDWAFIRSGGKSLPQACFRRWGRKSMLLLLPYALYFSVLPGYWAGQLSRLYVTFALIETPQIWLVIASLVAGAYIASQGPATLGRVAQFSFLVLLLLLGTITVGTLQLYDPARITPVFSRGPIPVIGASIEPAAWTLISLSTVPVLGGYLRWDSRNRMRPVLIGGSVLSVLVLTYSVLLITMTFGAFIASELVSPAYQLATLAQIKGVVERFEMIVLSGWITALFINIGASLLSAVLVLRTLFSSVRFIYHIIIPTILALLSAHFVFGSLPPISQNSTPVISVLSLVVAVLLPLGCALAIPTDRPPRAP